MSGKTFHVSLHVTDIAASVERYRRILFRDRRLRHARQAARHGSCGRRMRLCARARRLLRSVTPSSSLHGC